MRSPFFADTSLYLANDWERQSADFRGQENKVSFAQKLSNWTVR